MEREDHKTEVMPVSPPAAVLPGIEKARTVAVQTDSRSPSFSDSDLEKQEAWTAYTKGSLPHKRYARLFRNLRIQLLTPYQRLFGLIFLANLGLLIAFAVQEVTISKLAAACTGNLMVAIAIRNEHVINMLFRIFTCMPKSAPLFLRLWCAEVYHLGGAHSGCAAFSVFWLLYVTIKIMVSVAAGDTTISVPTIVITWLVLAVLIGNMAMAYPTFRARYHNSFERMHRFAGWSALGLVWIQIVLSTNDLRIAAGKSLGNEILTNPSIWFLVVITMCIVYPWLHLRKLPVRSEVLSPHAVRIYLDDRAYTDPPPGSFVRVSLSPVMEWHSFAAIPDRHRTGSYSIVVSKAGDWTSALIQNPSPTLWAKGLPACGVLHVSQLFRKIVIIGTGSGIGPCLAVLRGGRVDCRVLWTAPNAVATFGQELVDDVLEADKEAVIYDTRAHGRPDMVKLAYNMYHECGAEAVIIISNPKLTYKVVYGLLSRGVPTFGAIWDS